MKATVGMSGKIYSAAPSTQPIIAVLYREDEDGRIEVYNYSIPDPAGHYSFLVPEGVYYITAFEDANRTFTYTKNGCPTMWNFTFFSGCVAIAVL
jgi:hypothetical protein